MKKTKQIGNFFIQNLKLHPPSPIRATHRHTLDKSESLQTANISKFTTYHLTELFWLMSQYFSYNIFPAIQTLRPQLFSIHLKRIQLQDTKKSHLKNWNIMVPAHTQTHTSNHNFGERAAETERPHPHFNGNRNKKNDEVIEQDNGITKNGFNLSWHPTHINDNPKPPFTMQQPP